MNISYSIPLSSAWTRMKKALFQPFDIGKWFTVGFTAFLASLMNNTAGTGGYNPSKSYGDTDWQDLAEWPTIAWYWLMDHPVWFSFIIVGVVFLIAIFVILTWVSSRGKFMFLDNVVHDRAEVVIPWNEYRNEGNSLFIWRLVFGLISFLLLVISLIIAFMVMIDLFTGESTLMAKAFSLIPVFLGFLVFILFIAFITLLLNDFIVPVMYKHRITTTQAWLKFLPLLLSNFWDFIVYALFVFVLIIITVFAVIFFGIFTCCIGFLLLIIPYIGSVVLLPVTYTFRAFSISFIEQYGDDYTLFPKPETTNLSEQSEVN